jgi:hypothetical protein
MAGICRLFRKSPFDCDCVVADAVAIEPVSASAFPGIRENNSENPPESPFWAWYWAV